MRERPLFSGPILSRPTGKNAPSRRLATLSGAVLLHLSILALPFLVPLFVVEMVKAPEATIPIIYRPPPDRSFGPVSQSPGRARNGEVDPAESSRPSVTPRVVPLEQPAPNPEPVRGARNALHGDRRDGPPGPSPGPGLPDGEGEDPHGTRGGCPGCIGAGPHLLDPDPRESRIYEWDPDVIAPVLIPSTRVLPKYPRAGRLAGVDGSVILLIAILPDGTVGEIEVLRAPDPRFGFEFAAIEAIKRWRYRPGLMHGRPVAVYRRVIVEFILSR